MSHLRQGPVNEISWVQAIEPVALQSWPPRQIQPLSGWKLRFTDGYGHRANSVTAPDFSGSDVTEAIDTVERAYRARGLKPMFQINPASKPEGLADLLLARGYRAVTPTFVCVAEVATVRSLCPSAGDVRTDANGAFDALVMSGSHSPADGRERLEILSRIAIPHVRVTILADDTGVACGVGATASGLLGINLMRTHAHFRRRGYARQALRVLADWAAAQGAGTLFLSVEEANAPARALYERVGFVPAYAYRHYCKD